MNKEDCIIKCSTCKHLGETCKNCFIEKKCIKWELKDGVDKNELIIEALLEENKILKRALELSCEYHTFRDPEVDAISEFADFFKWRAKKEFEGFIKCSHEDKGE